jgi:hypothetical protein
VHFRYKKRKKELMDEIEEENEKKRICDHSITFKRNLIAQVRISLRQIHQLCKTIKTPEEKVLEKKQAEFGPFPEDAPVPPEEDEIDGNAEFSLVHVPSFPVFFNLVHPSKIFVLGRKIIAILVPKLSFLMSNVAEKLDDSKIDTAYRFYEILMKERCVEPDVEVVTDECE